MKKIKMDLHNHFSTKSRVLDPNRVADVVRERLGVGGICALVNYDDQRFEAFSKKAEPYATLLGNAVYFSDRDVLIVKGEEVPTLQGDLLVLGTQEGVHLTARKSLENTLKEANELQVISILPHPYYHSKTGDEVERNPELVNLLDGIETHNGNATKSSNAKALYLWSLVNNYELYAGFVPHNFPPLMKHVGSVKSSDGHSFEEVGSSFREIFPNHRGPAVEFSWKNTDEREVIKEIKGLIQHGEKINSESRYSTIGKLKHIAILASMIVASKFGINLSRGDAEALRQ